MYNGANFWFLTMCDECDGKYVKKGRIIDVLSSSTSLQIISVNRNLFSEIPYCDALYVAMIRYSEGWQRQHVPIGSFAVQEGITLTTETSHLLVCVRSEPAAPLDTIPEIDRHICHNHCKNMPVTNSMSRTTRTGTVEQQP